MDPSAQNHMQSLKPIYVFGTLGALGICLHFIASTYFSNRTPEVKWTMPQPFVSLLTTSSPETELQPMCSNSFLRAYFRAHHFFPDEFKWHKMEYFLIKGCTIPTLKNFSACLKRLSVNKIVFLGDSQGTLLKEQLVEALGSAKYSCTPAESKPTPKVYNFRNANGTTVISDKCSTCNDETMHCVQAETKATVDFQYVSILWLNTKLEAKQINGNNTITTKTFMEFLFKIYFRNNYPDLLLFEIPFNHVKYGSVEDFEVSLRSLMNALKSTMKPNTRVVFFPGFAEHESKRAKTPPSAAYYFNLKYQGYLATDQIYRMTRAMWNVLEKDLLSETSNIFSHANFVNATKPALPINKDGIHYIPELYAHIMKIILGTLCFE